ncbi:hypothetical protein JZ751_019131 [Albula glossodonta]|uniref:POU domain protein n=1 Tax=Albula glossodonta TaxID=121402 RepID=A0A8T2NNG8_9TELE|nr:hypothetical protein JZ751_019131 [Albula glossodonta]
MLSTLGFLATGSVQREIADRLGISQPSQSCHTMDDPQTAPSEVDGVNLEEIREFAKAFKIRRLSLGLTQTQVGQALSATEGPAYSQSAICRLRRPETGGSAANEWITSPAAVSCSLTCDRNLIKRRGRSDSSLTLAFITPQTANPSVSPPMSVISRDRDPKELSLRLRSALLLASRQDLKEAPPHEAQENTIASSLTAKLNPGLLYPARFEKLDITPKSAQKIKPVLERWMAEAEARHRSGMQNLTEFIGSEPSKKRKRRTSFTPQALEILNSHFEKNTHPSGQEMTEIAEKLNYDREVVRVWFCNKRQALKNTIKRLKQPELVSTAPMDPLTDSLEEHP